jgi:hypothetical protein
MPSNPDDDLLVDDIAHAEPEKGDSVFDQFVPDQVVAVQGPDGLPMDRDPAHSFEDSLPPPLTPQTMVCLPQTADPENGRTEDLPACAYYRRQRYSSSSTPGATQIDRYCTHPSQRGLNGACTILRDSAIYQCELRDPPDQASYAVLEAIDSIKIAQGIERLKVEADKRKAIDDGKAAIAADGKAEPARRYRMFRTRDDVEAGRRVLDADDFEKEPGDAHEGTGKEG